MKEKDPQVKMWLRLRLLIGQLSPVCGKKVCGNFHLDDCVSRGTKRKLSQCTLLQLNFCSRTKIKIHSTESEYSETNVIQTSADNNAGNGTLSNFSDLGAEDDKNQCKSPKSSDYVMHTDVVGSAENIVHDERINYKANSPPLFYEMSKLDTAETLDDIYDNSLATYIVARRFTDKVELNSGATISLLRDPDNAKDPNAIKVLTADSGCSKAVGFLPRELAQYLSPLMDKFGLSFEGSITSVPAHTLAVAQFRLFVKKGYSLVKKNVKIIRFSTPCGDMLLMWLKVHKLILLV